MPRAAARAVPAGPPARLVENIDIARVFEEVADLLEIQGRISSASGRTAQPRARLKH